MEQAKDREKPSENSGDSEGLKKCDSLMKIFHEMHRNYDTSIFISAVLNYLAILAIGASFDEENKKVLNITILENDLNAAYYHILNKMEKDGKYRDIFE